MIAKKSSFEPEKLKMGNLQARFERLMNGWLNSVRGAHRPPTPPGPVLNQQADSGPPLRWGMVVRREIDRYASQKERRWCSLRNQTSKYLPSDLRRCFENQPNPHNHQASTSFVDGVDCWLCLKAVAATAERKLSCDEHLCNIRFSRSKMRFF